VPLDDRIVTDLKDWLDRLDRTWQKGEWRPLEVGVDNWLLQAMNRLQTAERCYVANIEKVNLRRELRGRLDALRAKAQEQGLAENAALAELEQAAKALLARRPTPLNQLEKLVANYAARLRG